MLEKGPDHAVRGSGCGESDHHVAHVGHHEEHEIMREEPHVLMTFMVDDA